MGLRSSGSSRSSDSGVGSNAALLSLGSGRRPSSLAGTSPAPGCGQAVAAAEGAGAGGGGAEGVGQLLASAVAVAAPPRLSPAVGATATMQWGGDGGGDHGGGSACPPPTSCSWSPMVGGEEKRLRMAEIERERPRRLLGEGTFGDVECHPELGLVHLGLVHRRPWWRRLHWLQCAHVVCCRRRPTLTRRHSPHTAPQVRRASAQRSADGPEVHVVRGHGPPRLDHSGAAVVLGGGAPKHRRVLRRVLLG
jgi:hypothetical protein